MWCESRSKTLQAPKLSSGFSTSTLHLTPPKHTLTHMQFRSEAGNTGRGRFHDTSSTGSSSQGDREVHQIHSILYDLQLREQGSSSPSSLLLLHCIRSCLLTPLVDYTSTTIKMHTIPVWAAAKRSCGHAPAACY